MSTLRKFRRAWDRDRIPGTINARRSYPQASLRMSPLPKFTMVRESLAPDGVIDEHRKPKPLRRWWRALFSYWHMRRWWHRSGLLDLLTMEGRSMNRTERVLVACLLLCVFLAGVLTLAVILAKPAKAADITFTIPTRSALDSMSCESGRYQARVARVQVQWRDNGIWRMLQYWSFPPGSRDGRPVRIRTARADTALIRARTADSLYNWSCWKMARWPRVTDLEVR